MLKNISRKNIPESGDIVDTVKYNKERSLCCIVFDNGKKIYFHINPGDFGKSIKKKKLKFKTKIKENKINSMDRNSPNDENYQRQARETLARLKGVSVEEVQQNNEFSNHGDQIQMPSNQNTDSDFEAKKQAVLESSKRRSEMLSKEISRTGGGKLLDTFGDKRSVEL